MTKPGPLNKVFAQLGYAFGYSLTSVWATVLLFSSLFSIAGTASVVTASMLPGVAACLGVLLLGPKAPMFDGRNAAASVYATGMAVGTLLCTFPAFSAAPLVHDAGLVVSGFFAILLILAWFEVFARLSARRIVFLAGLAVLFSAVGCFVVLSLPIEAASIVMAALPIVSFSLLPRPEGEGAPARADAPAAPSLGAVLREAVSWKTLLGIVISFFVIGAIGTLAPGLGMVAGLSPAYLLIPAALTALFVLIAFAAPERIDGSVLFKLLLVGVAALAFVLVYYGATDLTLVFFIYITADVLLWTVLALASKKTPVAPYAVFATGWLAECAGNVLGHNVCALMGNTPYLLALVILLILVGVGFAFGDGLFVLELGEAARAVAVPRAAVDSMPPARPNVADEAEPFVENGTEAVVPAGSIAAAQAAEQTPVRDAAQQVISGQVATKSSPDPVAASNPVPDPIAAFVARHGLSEREADVFALWVTGHGLKHIQDTLFIGESTVKTHLRSIYRKCGTHNRAEIIALFEGEFQ